MAICKPNLKVRWIVAPSWGLAVRRSMSSCRRVRCGTRWLCVRRCSDDHCCWKEIRSNRIDSVTCSVIVTCAPEEFQLKEHLAQPARGAPVGEM